MARFISLRMFEKWTKKASSKFADNAMEGVKQSLNDRISQYGDIIQIGLVLGVIILGSRHITSRKHEERRDTQYFLPPANGQGPVIVNNYYREREEIYHERNQRACHYIQNGRAVPQQAKKAAAKY